MSPNVVTILVPFAVMVLGALVYALAANPKASEMGRLAYFAGLVVLVFVLAHSAVRL